MGVSIDWVNEEESNRTALHAAVQLNDEGIVNDLLNYRYSVNVQDSHGTTPLHIAASHGSLEIIECLLACPDINISLVDSSERSALYIAIFTGHKAIANRLLELELKLKQSNWTSFHLSGLLNETNFSNFDPSAKYPASVTPLHIAASFNNINSIQTILTELPKIPLKDILQRSPLHYAAASGSLDALILLLDSGFDINARDCQNKTPLHFAAGLGRVSK